MANLIHLLQDFNPGYDEKKKLWSSLIIVFIRSAQMYWYFLLLLPFLQKIFSLS